MQNDLAARISILVFAWLAGATLFGQGKPMRYEMEVKQLKDMQEGVLLVPIDMRSSGLGESGSQAEAIHARIERKQIQLAFAEQFTFGQVLFYNAADSLEVQYPVMLETWTVQGDPPKDWPPAQDKIFLLEYKPAGEDLDQDVIAFNRGIQKREQKAVVNEAKQIEKRRLKAQKLRQKIQLHGEEWEEDKLARFSDQLAELENGRDTTAFLLTYSAFDPENQQFPGWVIHRQQRLEVIPNERFRYLFDFHYFVRLHEEIAPEIRYERAVAHLQRRLEDRIKELEERFD